MKKPIRNATRCFDLYYPLVIPIPVPRLSGLSDTTLKSLILPR
jgi:hypothetical protein